MHIANANFDQPMIGFDVSQFNDILLAKPQPLLVGGQAVNLWAKVMLPQIPDLEQFKPFLSKDCDIYGNQDLLLQYANKPPWLVAYSKPGQASPVVGYLYMEKPTGETLLIEVLYTLKGLTSKDLTKESRVEFEGSCYRILNPVTLLKAKLANYSELPQNTPGQEREDLKHIRILVPCVKGFLHDALANIKNSVRLERDLVKLLEETLQIVTSEKALRASTDQRIDFSACFPPVLTTSNYEKIRNFCNYRLLPLKG